MAHKYGVGKKLGGLWRRAKISRILIEFHRDLKTAAQFLVERQKKLRNYYTPMPKIDATRALTFIRNKTPKPLDRYTKFKFEIFICRES
jgi:hypothetical protein